MPIDVEYWTDPLCIWAYVGHSRLDHVLEEYGDQIHVRYRIIPIFGDIPTRFATGSWSDKGRSARAETTRRVAQEHAGIEITGSIWEDEQLTSSWPVGEAIEAVGLLEDAGHAAPGAKARYQWTVRRWFFEENRRMSDRALLLQAAEACDLSPDAVAARLDDGSAAAALWRDHKACQELKVRGSPTWVFDGGRAMLYGNFQVEILNATVRALVDGMELGGSRC